MMSSSVAADVHHQPLSESILEEQDIDADCDGYQREHVKHDHKRTFADAKQRPAKADTATFTRSSLRLYG